MNSNLLKPEVQAWIQENKSSDFTKLAFSKSPFPEIEMKELISQLQGRAIAKNKFPFLENQIFYFPPKINLEQTSSQATAEYKSSLVKGELLLDLTGGLGIDSLFFAENFKQVYHFEINPELQSIAAKNFELLEKNNINSQNTNAVDFCKDFNGKADVIFLDPSRRNQNQQKVFLLEDLTPNLLEIKDEILSKCQEMWVKLSPMIDLNYLVKTLPQITEIHLVALKNEMKEVLIKLKENSEIDPQIICVNLQTDQKTFKIPFSQENSIEYVAVQKYIYEPNVAIQKSGKINEIGREFGFKKLDPYTQLLTNDQLISDFPGRIFEFNHKIENPKKELKNQSVMLLHRNYPENIAKLIQKYKLKNDGTQPVLFCKNLGENLILSLSIIKL